MPVATGGAIAVIARLQSDRDGAPETALLGILAFVALAALAALPRAAGAMRLTALATVAITLVAPAGPARGFAVTVVLAVAVASGLLAATRDSLPGVAESGIWIPIAVAVQALAHPRLLPAALDGGRALLTLSLDWLVLPAICGAAAASLAARHGRSLAGIGTGLAFVLGGGWTWIGAGALTVLTLLGRTRRPAAAAGRSAGIAAGLTLCAVLATVTASGYPWLTSSPARTALAALLALPRRTEAVLSEPVVLDRSRPDWRQELGARAAGAAVFDTYLVGGGDLAPGTTVAVFGVGLSGGAALRRELRVAGEMDSSGPGPQASVARVYHLAGDGRTFVARWRTRIPIPEGGRISELTLERLAETPSGLEIVLWWAGTEQ